LDGVVERGPLDQANRLVECVEAQLHAPCREVIGDELQRAGGTQACGEEPIDHGRRE
jgi:hypothetical protein